LLFGTGKLFFQYFGAGSALFDQFLKSAYFPRSFEFSLALDGKDFLLYYSVVEMALDFRRLAGPLLLQGAFDDERGGDPP
jgi:hypothetical protein